MNDDERRAALQRHWAASDANDFDVEHAIYDEQAVLEYPQSGERLRGRQHIQASRMAQPDAKRFAVRRVLGAGGWLARGESDAQVAGIASLSREASASYATYALDATRPVEIDGAHKAQLASWVSERLRRPVPVPDLRSSGYGLVGGRLVATEHGPAALFLYDDASGTRIAVLARPMTIERDTPQMRRNDGRFGGYSWADDGLGFGVVGNTTAGDLHPLADEVRKQTRVSL